MLRAAQQVAGLGNAGIGDEVLGADPHDFTEHPSEVGGGGKVAQRSQILHCEGLHIVFFHIVQGRADNQQVVRGTLFFFAFRRADGGALGLNPEDFDIKGEQKPPAADLIGGLFVLQLPYNGGNQLVQEGMLPAAENELEASGGGEGVELIVFPGVGQQVFEKLLGIDKQIGPVTGAARIAVGGMGDIAGDNRNIPLPEGQGLAGKFHNTAVGMADTDFQAVVEMQPPAGHVGNTPVIPG